MYKLPYYSSLNSQMAEYYKQVKMQEYNDTYQQAQLDIVLDGQRNLASSAEIMNKLTELQKEITNQSVNTLIPLERTNAPEISNKLSLSEKAHIISTRRQKQEDKKKTNIEVIKNQKQLGINYLEPEPPIIEEKARPKISKEDINNILSKFEKKPNTSKALDDEITKNLKDLVKSPNVSNAFINELQKRVKSPNLISNTTRTKAEKKIFPLKAELLAKVEQMSKNKKITENEIMKVLDNTINKIEINLEGENRPTLLSPSSSSATFQQSSMDSPIEKKKGRTTMTGKTIIEIKDEFINKIKAPLKLENYEIRIEKNKPIIKDLTTGADIQKPPSQLIHTLYNEYKIAGNGLRKKKSIPKRNAKGKFIKA